MRIDKFLKASRLVKRRTAAQEMIEVGAVRVNGRPCKSSSEVSEGCVVDVAYTARVLTVRVLCADEQLLKRPQTAAYELLEERGARPDEKPW
ncbi:MAG: RNA-binding S4 domain-containing protein [Synergistaceae bacterium]|jgi:ribosomal 50S subunit-recycling heat shock protein|nr:RNA-binding S4 domain-containing protein [Synergistaceae bacterium]